MSAPEPSWKYRRRAVFGTLLFGGLVILWALFSSDDRPVLDTIVLAVSGLMGAALSVYTGAAAYQDVRLRRYQDPWTPTGDYEDGSV